jgi:Bacterial SH3 domain
MTSARHRAEARSRARSLFRRFVTPTALAATATTGVVAAGIVGAGAVAASGQDDLDLSRAGAGISQADLSALDARKERIDRSADRTDRTLQPVTLEPQAVRHVWSTAPLNVWAGPREQGPNFRVLDSGSKVAVTGQRVGNWAEVLVEGRRVRWVNATYLANHKPRPETAASSGATTSGVSTAPCPDGSATESGLVPNAVTLYRAVCNAFPQLTTYGGYDPHGEHADGHAIDFMISDSATGQAVADWVRANASSLHVYDVIWSQHIWTPERAAEGWRYMSDRGSPTANHYDHVHVAVY